MALDPNLTNRTFRLGLRSVFLLSALLQGLIPLYFTPIYVKLCAFFQQNGDRIDFFHCNGITISYLELNLIKPDSDKISTLEPFVSQKVG